MFCELKSIKNKPFNYNLSYTYISKPKVKEVDNSKTVKVVSSNVVLKNNESASKDSKTKMEDLSKGIYVFVKDGCSRCALTLKYLDENNIKHKVFYISKNKESGDLMWAKLAEINFFGGKLTMPIIIVDGKISYSHKDLQGFLKNLSN